MAYKPNQLPFEEFHDCVREMKLTFDNTLCPHYPIYADAYDSAGQHLCAKTFMGPNARPGAQIVAQDDWTMPVTVIVRDQDHVNIEMTFVKVTPLNAETEDVPIPELMESIKKLTDAEATARKRWKKEIEAELDQQRKAKL
jgi:hypothetical protein